jgi:hypothetical protein
MKRWSRRLGQPVGFADTDALSRRRSAARWRISRSAAEAIYECIRQYIYDAVAEYRVAKLIKVTPDSVRRMKDALLRADANRIENLDAPAANGTTGAAPAE